MFFHQVPLRYPPSHAVKTEVSLVRPFLHDAMLAPSGHQQFSPSCT